MRVAIYCRVFKGQPINDQLKLCTDYCEAHGFDIVGVYMDVLKESPFWRPEYYRMIWKPNFERIVTLDRARFARGRYDGNELIKDLNERYHVIYVSEQTN